MVHGIGARETNRKVVRNGIHPQSLGHEEFFCEVCGQFVTDVTDEKSRIKEPIVRVAERVWEGPSVALEIGLVRPVILLAKQVGGNLIREFPRSAGMAAGVARCVP